MSEVDYDITQPPVIWSYRDGRDWSVLSQGWCRDVDGEYRQYSNMYVTFCIPKSHTWKLPTNYRYQELLQYRHNSYTRNNPLLTDEDIEVMECSTHPHTIKKLHKYNQTQFNMYSDIAEMFGFSSYKDFLQKTKSPSHDWKQKCADLVLSAKLAACVVVNNDKITTRHLYTPFKTLGLDEEYLHMLLTKIPNRKLRRGGRPTASKPRHGHVYMRTTQKFTNSTTGKQYTVYSMGNKQYIRRKKKDGRFRYVQISSM
jgi:hypothetical protein